MTNDVSSNNVFEELVKSFLDREVIPFCDEWEKNKNVPTDILFKLSESGILQQCDPCTLLGKKNKLILANAMGKTRSMGITCMVLNHLNIPMRLLSEYASPFLKDKYLIPALRGEMLGAVGITEKKSGSDLTAIEDTVVEFFEDSMVLNGQKTFILNVPGADFVLVLCKEIGSTNQLSFTWVLVPSKCEGIRMERIQTTPLHTVSIGNIIFENCLLPLDHIVGKRDRGVLYLNNPLAEERLIGSVAILSLMEEIIQSTLDFVSHRKFTHGVLRDMQVVRHRMAEMVADYEVVSAYCEEVKQNWLCNRKEATQQVAMLRLLISDTAQTVVDACLQLNGGRGYLETNWLSRAYRDLLAASSFAGTQEILKEQISVHIMK